MAKIIKVEAKAPKLGAIAEAARVIRAGGLVVYPTETVYGLGADARSDTAVAEVFSVKARPIENPIPVAVSSLKMAEEIAEFNPGAEAVFKRFMPGPLTIVLRARPGKISRLLMGGSENIGIRAPDHPVALKLIELVGGPITTTSANISGRPAPTAIGEAQEQLGEKFDLALDAGACAIGAPSTVVDLSAGRLKILREGPVTEEQIKRALVGST